MPSIYAARSLVIYALRFNQRGKSKEVYSPVDINGDNALDLFEEYARLSKMQLSQIGRSPKFLALESFEGKEEGVLLSYSSGRAGEDGRIVDTNSGRTVIEYDPSNANMVGGRVFLRVRGDRSYALLCVEHVTGGAGDTTVAEHFKSFLRERKPEVTLKREAVMEKQGIDAVTSVENVEVIRYLAPDDIADPLTREGDRVIVKLAHMRNHPFELNLFRSLISNRSKTLKSIFGTQLTDAGLDEDGLKVEVTAKLADGRTRKFELSESFDQPLREVLNNNGEPPLPDNIFTKRCIDRCEYFESIIG